MNSQNNAPDNLTEALSLRTEQERIIAITGAGGKTTLMFRLAEELAEKNLRVLVTTTTKIFKPDDRAIINPGGLFSLEPGCIAVVGAPCESDKRKLTGVLPEQPALWLEQNLCDIVLVEADGAREKPMKAPAIGEPVLPDSCDVVIAVTGWDGIRAPAGPESIHRWPLFQSLTGQREGRPVSGQSLVGLLKPVVGLFGSPPLNSRLCWLINKLDSFELRDKAWLLGWAVLGQSTHIERALLASLANEDEPVECLDNRQESALHESFC